MSKFSYFLNRNNSVKGFEEAVNGKYLVDKSKLIDIVSEKISTKEKYICVCRPRRFGKTMAIEMLSAYYTKELKSDYLFKGLVIKNTINYYRHLNAHNVFFINFNDYFEDATVEEGIQKITDGIIADLKQAYPEILADEKDLVLCLDIIEQVKNEKFIFLIDEWDCVFRIHKGRGKEQEKFLSFLRWLFKDKSYVELVYMTGILPIKKYNTGSALNMFREYTMVDPKKLAPYFGFTKDELIDLCKGDTTVSVDKLLEWYDGYYMPAIGGICNPRSVIEALEEGVCKDYWSKTGGFSELEEYITINFDGLGQAVTDLVAGSCVAIDVLGFSNDLDSFQDKDEVLTALVHLGYLTFIDGKVQIPNKEIREEFANTIKKLSWGMVSALLRQSRELLAAVLNSEEEKVALMLEDVHDGMQEFKEYNNEHTLKCVIHLAFYAAADDYILKFESSAGKGYADCLMLPRRSGIPGIIVELKYGSSAEVAIQQIRTRDYIKGIEPEVRKILLVGINYNKVSKKHECRIECIER